MLWIWLQVPSNKFSSPEDRVTLWSWLTFSFVEPILDLAVQRSHTRISTEPGKNSTVSLTVSQPSTWTSRRSVDVTTQSLGAASTLAAETLGEEVHLFPSMPNSPPSRMDSPTSENDPPPKTIEEEPSLGPKRTLNEEDVWSLPPTFLHRNLFRKYLARRAR